MLLVVLVGLWAVPLIASVAAGALASLDPFTIVAGHAAGGHRSSGVWLVDWTVLTVKQAGETLSSVANTDTLVTAGAFAHTRNPLYPGVVLIATGVAVGLGPPVAAVYAGLLLFVYHSIVVTIEKPDIETRMRRSTPSIVLMPPTGYRVSED